ncbi:MAG: universal stress protein [Planctomycetia bacterium]
MTCACRVILCPTDLSPVSDDALELAFTLALPGGTVHLLHVLEEGVLATVGGGGPLPCATRMPRLLDALERELETRQRRLRPRLAASGSVLHRVHVAHDLPPATAIERTAADVQAELIVMGTHGNGHHDHLTLGSVARDVLAHTHLPVLLARPAVA